MVGHLSSIIELPSEDRFWVTNPCLTKESSLRALILCLAGSKAFLTKWTLDVARDLSPGHDRIFLNILTSSDMIEGSERGTADSSL